MSANPLWKFELVRSADMTLIRELNAGVNRQLQLENNKPGTFSFQLPIDAIDEFKTHPDAWDIHSRSPFALLALSRARSSCRGWQDLTYARDQSYGRRAKEKE